LRLIAELDPKPEVPALVEPIGPAPPGRATHAALVEALSGPIRQLPPEKRPEDWIEATTDDETEDWSAKNSEGAAGEPVDAEEHQRALRYRVQFTASQEFVDLLEEASDLIGHETQRVTLPEIQTRALRALVQQLRARKRAATKVSSPTPSSSPVAERRSRIVSDAPPARASVPDAAPARSRARHIPASVRRAVFERDGGRCAYQDDRGERCRETFGLEVHHRHAHALGGSATLDNLELRCRPHNALAAEEDFGQKYMESCGALRMTRISP
jgi:5-methylcytosine-specific restriction endonuclease McrA